MEVLAYSPSTTTFGTNKGDKVLNFISLIEHRELSDWYIDFDIPLVYSQFVEVAWIIYAPTKEKGYQAFRINSIKVGNTIKGRAYHIGFDTKNYAVELATVIDGDCSAMLAELSAQIDGTHPFTFYSNITSLQSYSVIDLSLYDGLMGIADKWGGYLDFDNWQIQIVSSIGTNRQVVLRYGKNIQETEITENWDNVVTKMKPIGNNDIVLTPEWLTSTNDYGTQFTKIIRFDTDDVDSLRFVATLYLARFDVPLVNYKVKTDVEQNIGIGDTVSVIARQFTTSAEVLAYDYSPAIEKVIAIEFGNYRPTVKYTINSKIEAVEEKTVKRVQVKIDNANNSISLISEDLTETNGQLDGVRSDLTVFSSAITATVSELGAGLNASIASLELRATSLEVGFQTIQTDGVEKVDTKTGIRFDINGQTFDTTQSNAVINVGWRNNFQDAGVFLSDKTTGEVINSFTEDGTKSKILEVSGLLRFQEYEPSAGVKSVGVFWIGD